MDAEVTKRRRPPRRDDQGRAFKGSQLQTQIWVNCRGEALSSAILSALQLDRAASPIQWKSPVAEHRYRELRDGRFLESIGQLSRLADLKEFWPKGGPVWDAVGISPRSGSTPLVFLVEGKSYPKEVYGGGCKAVPNSDARTAIENSLNAAAQWLGIERPSIWLERMYQSANRLAYVHFLRNTLGLDAFLVNVCFAGDPFRPTTADEWHQAHGTLRRELGLASVATPWLVDVVLPAGSRDELVPGSSGQH